MTGGFLGQVLRGRARIPRWMSCGRVAMAAWVGLLLWSGVTMAQSVPAATSPAPTRIVGHSSAGAPPRTQQTPPAGGKAGEAAAIGNTTAPSTSVWEWKGLIVDRIVFEGVTFGATDLLPKELTQKVGVPLNPLEVRASLRRLFASGLYRDIEVRGVREGDRVTLIFAGVSRYFVGRVTIAGVNNCHARSRKQCSVSTQHDQ
jgi:outer membrane protein insertion porin family